MNTNDDCGILFNRDTTLIKLIAVIAMFSDHLGKIFFPEITVLQIFGRISFPIFAYCLAVGASNTSDIKRYMLRLGGFAIISQPFYVLALNPFTPRADNLYDFLSVFYAYLLYGKNILFSLLLGLCAIYFFNERRWLLLASALFFAAAGGFDYGLYGVLLMLSFYAFGSNTKAAFSAALILIFSRFFMGQTIEFFGFSVPLQGFSALSLPLIFYPPKASIKINRYFFYIFYPAHLFVLYIVQLL